VTILAAGLIVLSAAAAYHNSFAGTFAYDDKGGIVDNPTIRRLWPPGLVLSPPCNGETVGGRPLLNLSLAINYALGGLNVWGYHATNLAIHAAAALLLFGILRRTLLMPTLRDRFGKVATPLALASTVLWTVHPLQTESVTYIVQRAESLAGFFYLLTLYCVIRGAGSSGTVPFFAADDAGQNRFGGGEKGDSPPGGEKGDCTPWSPWYAAAVLACLLGMACKEILITAPLVVLLYDRTFLAGSFGEAWRQRWGLYLGLAATWGLLAYLVFSTGLIARQSEFGAPDPLSYARSEPGVILYYLRLSLWPGPLCMSYEWPVAKTLGEILPGMIVVGLLLAATMWGLTRRKAWGFLGAWFFMVLAPTSSIMPLNQLAHEHRMYLSLAAVAVLVVAGGYAVWDRLLPRPAGQGGRSPFSLVEVAKKGTVPAAKKGTVPGHATLLRWVPPAGLCAVVIVALGWTTVVRNTDYRSSLAIWLDMVRKRPDSTLAHNNLGNALFDAGRVQEAIEHYQQAFHLGRDRVATHNNLGLALAALGKIDEAIEHYHQALRLKPDDATTHSNLGLALATLGKTDEAIAHYREALRINPDHAGAHNNLGNALVEVGRVNEAIEHYRNTLQVNPDFAEAHNNLGNALAKLGQTNEAIEQYRQALRLKPGYADAHYTLGIALVGLGRTDEAIDHLNQALRLKPDFAAAHNTLGVVLGDLGRTDEATEQLNQALRFKADYAEAHSNLANVLIRAGRIDEAIEHYREALRLRPGNAEFHYNLGIALAKLSRIDVAIEHCREAVRLKPDFVDAQYYLGLALVAAGRSSEAIAHCRQCLQRLPNSVRILNQLAWLLAINDPAQGGDPAQAVDLAERALKLAGGENAQSLDTLAAAYAAAGRFPEAVAAAERAAELARATGQAQLAEVIRDRLRQYRAGRPYRAVPRAAAQGNP
jgi:tetratricopeptide (TPR) repeat protein